MSRPWQHLLAPLQAPYALALAARNLGYAGGSLQPRQLAWPVVSIGNLSVGGAGKTPIVIALAKLLQHRGMHVDVLSRGYGRRSPHAVERVALSSNGRESSGISSRGEDSDTRSGDAGRFGDEPLLIARATGAPVYVGASRWEAGSLAEREFARSGFFNRETGETGEPGALHLLDDGFQHRKLARTVDIVVVHPTDVSGHLLPVGRLREPLAALRRADFLILREDDTGSEAALRRAGMYKPIWRVRRKLAPPRIDGQAMAFCGIAHPNEFFRGLRTSGIVLETTVAFRDHHAFKPSDIRSIATRAQGAAALLTTEKDFVRLSLEAQKQLSRVAPLFAVPLHAELLDAERCASTLLDLLAARHPEHAAMRR